MEWIVIMPILFSIYVFLKNIKNQPMVLFSSVMLGLSLYAASHYFINLGKYNTVSAILFNHFSPIYLMIGPSFYFFVLFRLEIINKLKPIHLLHLIPALVHLISISEYLFLPWSDKIAIVQNIYNNPSVQESLRVNLFFPPKFNYGFRMIHFATYCIVVLIMIRKSLLTENFNKRILKSIQKITIIFLLLTLFYSVHILFILITNSFTANFIQIILLIDVVLLAILFYELFNYPELLFSSKKFKKSYLKFSPFLDQKIPNNSIPEAIYNDIDKKICSLKEKRSFLIKPSTNFEAFANNINQSQFHIRSYLKSKNSSFIKLKNEARVEEAIKYLESRKVYKLDYIAKMSGFNTRSNFFKIFKKIMNCTPNQYEKKNNFK